MLEVVLFDCGGVVLDSNVKYLYRTMFAEETQMKFFLENVLTKKIRSSWNAGAYVAEEVVKLAQQYPEYQGEILAFFDRYTETVGGLIEGMPELMSGLKKDGVLLYLLTNWGRDTFPKVRQAYPLLDEMFDSGKNMLVSGDVGMKKPSPEIFKLAAQKFGLNPATTLFVDDQEKNTSVARRLGFQTELFTTAETLRETIERVRLI
jgi:2-haloacid dehalogenase